MKLSEFANLSDKKLAEDIASRQNVWTTQELLEFSREKMLDILRELL